MFDLLIPMVRRSLPDGVDIDIDLSSTNKRADEFVEAAKDEISTIESLLGVQRHAIGNEQLHDYVALSLRTDAIVTELIG